MASSSAFMRLPRVQTSGSQTPVPSVGIFFCSLMVLSKFYVIIYLFYFVIFLKKIMNT